MLFLSEDAIWTRTPVKMHWEKPGSPKPHILMVVWGGLSCPAGAGDGKQDLGRASRGSCCPENLPPGRGEAPAPWPAFASPGSWGLGASQALLELTTLSAWLWKSWFSSIGRWRILSPMFVLATPSAACKEQLLDNLMRYLALKRSLCCVRVLTFMKTHI